MEPGEQPPATITEAGNDRRDDRKTQAVTKALRDRLERIRRQRSGRSLAGELDDIALHCASLPVLDGRRTDEILGYDEDGLPI